MDISEGVLARLEAVRALHLQGEGHNPLCGCGIAPGSGARCKGCSKDWPCPTITALSVEGES